MATRTGKPAARYPWARVVSWIAGVPLALLAATSLMLAILRGNPPLFVAVAERLMPRKPVETWPTDADGNAQFFKYGAIGNEAADGLPLKIWRALPQACRGLMPAAADAKAGYEAFGFTFERDGEGRKQPTPIGLSRTRLGARPFDIEVVAINCAACHVQTYTLPGETRTRIFVGGANNRLNALAYTRFVAGCAESDGFETETLMAAMQAHEPMPAYEAAMYRYLVIPVARDLIRDRLGARFHWTWSRPEWGPGRLSPFNPVKFDYLRQPVDQTIDHADVMPAWNVSAKERLRSPTLWHWDGLSADLREVVVNSALGDGTTRFGYREETIDRLVSYLRTLQSPPSPLNIDPALRAEGERIFRATGCVGCHAAGGARVMTIIPQAEIATDPGRIAMWTPEAAAAYNNYDKGGWRTTQPWYARWTDAGLDWLSGRPPGLPWVFSNFRKYEGYLAQPLDGIWLTAPYLHNGSVPTLDDLLKPPAERPKAFVRGRDALDLVRGGYVAPACEPTRYTGEFCYDTTRPGNANAGHDYGTTLGAADRRALVHYLLSL